MALLMSVIVTAFWLMGGGDYAFMGLIVGAVINFGVYWFSDKIVLSMTKAKEADRMQYPQLYEIVERLSRKAGMPAPRVYVIQDSSLNAFATGRGPGHAAVVVHIGLLQVLSPEEIEGVIGHELTHIKRRDILISTVAAVMAGTLTYLQYALFFGGDDRRDRGGLALLAMILAPIAGMLIQMAISRTREYGADAGGAQLSNPSHLASALRKIDASVRRSPMRGGNPATAHMYIMNPFSGVDVFSLFSTHPPVEERIRRLGGMRFN